MKIKNLIIRGKRYKNENLNEETIQGNHKDKKWNILCIAHRQSFIFKKFKEMENDKKI